MTDLLADARAEAVRLQHDYIGSEHLFLALLARNDPTIGTVLGAFDTTPELVRERVEQRSPQGRGAPANPEEISVRSGARKALDLAKLTAGGEPNAQHLLAALLGDGRGVIAASLGDVGVPAAKVREALGIAAPERAPAPERPPKPERLDPAERPAKASRGEPNGRLPKREKPPKQEQSARQEKLAKPSREERRDRAEPADLAVSLLEQLPTRGPVPERRGAGTGPRIAPVHEPFLTWRKLPLLAIPLSLYFNYTGTFAPWVVFSTACLAVLPLAGYMGEATEHLSSRTGPTLGGLLNATFGNAAELIIAIVALQAGLIDLVKASITGSIIGNLLLILGLSLLAGGFNRPLIKLNRTAVGMSAGMMSLAVAGLVFPSLFHSLHPDAGSILELHLSEAVAVVLALTYVCSLLFSLKTHKRLFGSEPHPTEGVLWSVPLAIGVLAIATVGVAVESEILVHAVEGLTAGSSWLSEAFLGLIVIPIIGNAAEHATAIVVARKGKFDLALQIAMGSSAQVALLIAPILILVGALMGPSATGSYMNLVFTPMEVVAMGLATILTAIVTLDGESHWFEGVQLLALYAMIAIAMFFV